MIKPLQVIAEHLGIANRPLHILLYPIIHLDRILLEGHLTLTVSMALHHGGICLQILHALPIMLPHLYAILHIHVRVANDGHSIAILCFLVLGHTPGHLVLVWALCLLLQLDYGTAGHSTRVI